MYKTIRHGENSLQYTILPQNDDFRIEGKLSGNGRSAGGASSSGSASSSSGAKVKGQRRRRSFFAYLGLIFVCTVIIGAVLIPFLVSAECLPNPTEWFLKTKAALIHSPQRGGGGGIVSAGGDMTGNPTLPTGSPLLQQNVGRNVQIVNRNGVEQFVIRLNKTTLSNLASTTTTSSSTTTTTSTTTTPAPTTTTSSSTSTTTTTTTREPVTTPRYSPPATTITTRIIQVPLLKSAAKKPIMPPVLAKAQGAQYQPGVGQQDAKMQTQSNQAEEQAAAVQNNRSNSAWLKTNWAYIDPSTYFQWTGYKAEDSVLLPALLGFALIGVILIITVCLVARNKRTIVSSVRKRNRNDIEEQGAEDNATLLTTTNLSDDD
ncbi:T-cell immunoglobulin and mucin domain-containing protein 4 [Drosophila kikkawai]|uniref:T-cell immunoglobulin and mucin domain-containing protein 4 n=1 Tax=Drosophila kikkawai TaxID=30033 RepID=A0A6P4IPU2_DROKI|nr:cell wall integrity and stress response component 2 [Drosophila kikkawai]KAH8345122.1 hypothetical protein KR059_006062 [Drosophila kikkawai]